jgi:hypothetical protein
MSILKKLALTLTVAASLPAMAANINVNIGSGHGGFFGGRPGFDRPFGRQIQCSAQNRRGQIFSAFGSHPRNVQARAIAKCSQFSRFSCFELGCR